MLNNATTKNNGAVNSSGEITELMGAFVKAQGVITHAVATKTNTYHNSKYADFSDVVEAIRAAFAEQDLGFMQFPYTRTGTIERSYREEVFVEGKKRSRPVYEMRKVETPNAEDPELPGDIEELAVPVMETVPVIYVCVLTRLIHSSGQWLESELEIPVSMGNNPAQAVGIASTYAKRYALQAIAGVATDEDDGQGLDGQGFDNSVPVYQDDYRDPRPNQTERPLTQENPPAREKPLGPKHPQGPGARLKMHEDRLRQAENITTLRALYEAGVRDLETNGTAGDRRQLEILKDELKFNLQPATNEEKPPEEPDPQANNSKDQPINW